MNDSILEMQIGTELLEREIEEMQHALLLQRNKNANIVYGRVCRKYKGKTTNKQSRRARQKANRELM